jgi:AraC-like DNA-binding protein
MPATTPLDGRTQWMRPPAALADRIDFILWQPPGTRAVESVHEVTPDANTDLLIEVSDTHCRAVLYGPVTRTVEVRTRADRGYAVVHFHPGAMPRLVDASAAELVDSAVELRRLTDLPVDALGERLVQADSMEARYASLLQTLEQVRWPARDTFDRALHHVLTREATPRVAELAEALHLSPRTLERAFRERVGLPPRMFHRILRLQSALTTLRSAPGRSIAEVAFASGYADHAHLTREFRALTGRTPSDFRAAP